MIISPIINFSPKVTGTVAPPVTAVLLVVVTVVAAYAAAPPHTYTLSELPKVPAYLAPYSPTAAEPSL